MAFLFAMLACAPLLARADNVAGLFKGVTGDVKVVRQAGTVAATQGMPVLVSDRVVTGPEASAGITLQDGTRLAVGASSELELRQYAFRPKESAYAFDLYLARGATMYTSGTLAKVAPANVKISTPSTVIGVRGTRFLVEAE